ncbi:MAG: MFS transporter [Acidimicrobiales bacterium]
MSRAEPVAAVDPLLDSRRAWVATVAVAAANGIGFGTAYSFGTFFKAMAAEFDTSNGATALIFGVTLLFFFGSGVVSGPISDRVGPRPVLAVGGTLFVAGLVATANAQRLWVGVLTYGIGVGLGCGLYVSPLTALVGRLFAVRRTTALSVAAAGHGLGTLIMSPLSQRIIAARGWRDAYLTIAAIAAAIIAVALVALVRPTAPPAALTAAAPRAVAPVAATASTAATGTATGRAAATASTAATDRAAATASTADTGRAAAAAAGPDRAADGYRAVMSRAAANPGFRSLCLATTLMSVALFVAFAFIVPFAQDHGVSPAGASRLVGIIGLSSVLGRLGLMRVAARVGPLRLLQITLVLQPLAYLTWLAAGGRYPVLVVFAVLLGISYGGFVSVSAEAVIHLVGLAGIGSSMGLMWVSFGVGGLIGPPSAGFLSDQVGGRTAVIILACVALLALALVASVPMGRAAAYAPGPGNRTTSDLPLGSLERWDRVTTSE